MQSPRQREKLSDTQLIAVTRVCRYFYVLIRLIFRFPALSLSLFSGSELDRYFQYRPDVDMLRFKAASYGQNHMCSRDPYSQ